jgi:hypothetical protein
LESEIKKVLTVEDRGRYEEFVKSLELLEDEEVKLIYPSWKPSPLFYIGYLIFTNYNMMFLHSEPNLEQPQKILQIPINQITAVKERKRRLNEHIAVTTQVKKTRKVYDFGVFTGFLKDREAPSNARKVTNEIEGLIKR